MNRLAAIDVGTNTILLLVADIDEDGRISPLRDMERTTRLGRGLAEAGRLYPEPVEKSIHVIDEYLTICKHMGVDRVLTVGTSALRDAENADGFLDSVRRRFGLTVQILSGDEEARLSYLGVEREWDRGSSLFVIDIGGGSVEFILGRKTRISALYSLDIGAVRLTETFLGSDPVTEEEYRQMMDHIARTLSSLEPPPTRHVVGLGGTITTISTVHKGKNRFDPSLIHGSVISQEDVARQVSLYKRLTLSQRRRILGLPQERADVILAGAAVLLRAMDSLGFDRLIVSCHGLRYGLVYAAAHGQCIEKPGESC